MNAISLLTTPISKSESSIYSYKKDTPKLFRLSPVVISDFE